MRRYAPRILSFTLSIFLLSTIIWSGTAVAETGMTMADSVQPSCSYNTTELKVGKAPSNFADTDDLVNNTIYTGSAHIASEDWLALQLPKSNSTTCTGHTPVESNLAYASPATPNSSTTHTVTSEINQSVTELEQFSVEYEIDPRLNNGLYRDNISRFGVDENKDGFIEKSLKDTIEYVTIPSSSTIQLLLDGNATIPSNSYLVVQYGDIQNPDYADKYRVDTTITGNRTSTDDGYIRYGKNETRLIGQSSSTPISSFSRNGSQLATLRPARTVFTNASMHIFLPAQPNHSQPQTYSLTMSRSRFGPSMLSQSNNVKKNITVFDRYVRTFSNAKIKNGTIEISGYTNIAPGSLLSVQVFNEGRFREKGAIVSNSQTWSINMSLPDELLYSDTLQINVVDHEREMLDQRTLFTENGNQTDSSEFGW